MSKKKTKRHSVLFIPAFVLALIGLLLFSQVGRCRETATGIVTSASKEAFEITYQVKTKKVSGSPTLHMGMLQSSIDYNEGDEVEILYNARNHKNFIIKADNFNVLSYILLGIGVALFLGDNIVGDSLPESFVFKALNKEVGSSKKEK